MPFINIAPSDPANDVETTQEIPTAPRMPTVTTLAPANDNDRDDDEEGSGGWGLLALLLAVSIGVHVALVAGLGHGGKGAGPRPHRRPAEVTMTIAPPKPAPPPAAKAPEPKAAKRLAVRAAPRAVEKAAAPPPPQAETPADFSGVTLTNDGPGPGWGSAVGNGQAMRGPIGTPGAKVTGRSVAGSSAEGAAGPPIVALGALSRPPVPPDLNGALEQHYPAEARRQGSPGQAVLKARVLPDGHVRDLVVVSQSAPGFGDACRATLRDSVWSAPLDKTGQPVATFVTYTCRFEVR